MISDIIVCRRFVLRFASRARDKNKLSKAQVVRYGNGYGGGEYVIIDKI